MINELISQMPLKSIAALAVALMAGIACAFICEAILKKWLADFAYREWKVELTKVLVPIRYIVPAPFMLLGISAAPFDARTEGVIRHFVSLWVIAAVGWLLTRCSDLIRESILARYDVSKEDNLVARKMHTKIRVIENLITVIIVVLTVAMMMMTFGSIRQVGMSILASAGVFGIVIGFSAQKTLGNLIAGIQIAIAQPMRLDDVVIVEGEWGWIEEINLTYVVVRIWDQRRLIVPISQFIEKPFQNWTRTTAQILGTVFIYTDYTAPVDKIRQKLTEILNQSSDWDRQVNSLQVTNATEKTVEIRALMSASTSPKAWDLRCEVREKLIQFLQEEYPQHLPQLRVETNRISESAK